MASGMAGLRGSVVSTGIHPSVSRTSFPLCCFSSWACAFRSSQMKDSSSFLISPAEGPQLKLTNTNGVKRLSLSQSPGRPGEGHILVSPQDVPAPSPRSLRTTLRMHTGLSAAPWTLPSVHTEGLPWLPHHSLSSLPALFLFIGSLLPYALLYIPVVYVWITSASVEPWGPTLQLYPAPSRYLSSELTNALARPGVYDSVGSAYPKHKKCWREWCDSSKKMGSHPRTRGTGCWTD